MPDIQPRSQPRRPDRQPRPALSIRAMLIIAVSVGIAAVIGTVVVLRGGDAGTTTPTTSASTATAPPTTASSSATPTPAAEPYRQAMAQFTDLCQRRADLTRQVREPVVSIINLRRFTDDGSEGVYEGILNHPQRGPSRCVLIADPARITDGALGLKSFTGRVVKLGEKPYVMTTTVRGALGETARESKEYFDTFRPCAGDPETDLQRVTAQLVAVEQQVLTQFPDTPEAKAIRQRQQAEAEEAQQQKSQAEAARQQAEAAAAEQRRRDEARRQEQQRRDDEAKRIQQEKQAAADQRRRAIENDMAALDQQVADLDAQLAQIEKDRTALAKQLEKIPFADSDAQRQQQFQAQRDANMAQDAALLTKQNGITDKRSGLLQRRSALDVRLKNLNP